MVDITKNIEVLHHSSIRITSSDKVIYIDPYKIKGEPHDADIILITHEHFDHFSIEDIDKVKKNGTRLFAPESMRNVVQNVQLQDGKAHLIVPGGMKESLGMTIKAIPAYNRLKPFHPKKNAWVGYLFEVEGVTIYVAGDTDMTDEASKVKCDVAMVPIGGKFTMDAKKAAELVNIIRPQAAIPIHYGSVAGSKSDEDVFSGLVNKDIRVEIKMKEY